MLRDDAEISIRRVCARSKVMHVKTSKRVAVAATASALLCLTAVFVVRNSLSMKNASAIRVSNSIQLGQGPPTVAVETALLTWWKTATSQIHPVKDVAITTYNPYTADKAQESIITTLVSMPPAFPVTEQNSENSQETTAVCGAGGAKCPILAGNMSARYVRAGNFYVLPSNVDNFTGQPTNSSLYYGMDALEVSPTEKVLPSSRSQCIADQTLLNGEILYDCYALGSVIAYSPSNFPVDLWTDVEITVSSGLDAPLQRPENLESLSEMQWLDSGCFSAPHTQPFNNVSILMSTTHMCTNSSTIPDSSANFCFDVGRSSCVLRIQCPLNGASLSTYILSGRDVVIVVRPSDEYSPSIYNLVVCE